MTPARPRVRAALVALSLVPAILAVAPPAYAASAQEHLDARRYAEALAAFEQAAKSDPAAHLGVAKSQIGLKHWREAAAALRAYRDQAPKAFAGARIGVIDAPRAPSASSAMTTHYDPPNAGLEQLCGQEPVCSSWSNVFANHRVL